MNELKLRHLVERAKDVVESRQFVETDGDTKDMVIVSRSALYEMWEDLFQAGVVHYGFQVPSRRFDGYIGRFITRKKA